MTPGRPPDDLPAANNFDLVRLGAALLVLASHSYVLTGQAAQEPVARLLGHVADGGRIAVGAFFAISGLLIARSVQRHQPGAYVRARVLRIYPAYCVVVLLQALVLGPLVTTLAPGAYMADPALWSALLRALVFSAPAGLPGVFVDNPVPGQVNGSLWTLRIEVLCYAGLLALAVAGVLRPGRVLVPLAGAWALLGVVIAARAGLLPAGLGSLRVLSVVECGLDFLMGAAAWVHRGVLPRLGLLAVAGLAALALLARTPLAPAALHVALPAAVLWLGLRPRLPRPARDVSYGTYLFAFPLQQLLVAAWPGIGPAALTLAAAPLALACGAASHVWVERPLMRRR